MFAHKFPMPLWNGKKEPIHISEKDLADRYGKADWQPGEILYCGNERDLEYFMKTCGFTDKYVKSEYPRALHGPENQSISVKNKDEEKIGVKNGWSLKPVVADDVPVEPRPTFATPPRAAQSVA